MPVLEWPGFGHFLLHQGEVRLLLVEYDANVSDSL